MALDPLQFKQRFDPDQVSMTFLGTFAVGTDFVPVRNLVLPAIQGRVAPIQSVWVDNIANPNWLRVQNMSTRLYQVWPRQSAGWFPLVMRPDASDMQLLASAGGTNIALAVSSYPFCGVASFI